ncbi:MAG: hypothetical protein IAE63_03820 [Alphaproteobacteria bacterium]|nr:hypothetical protein [Alphaproteobacteria bacterium]
MAAEISFGYKNGGGCSLSIKILRGNHGLSAKTLGILIVFPDYKMTLTWEKCQKCWHFSKEAY